MERIANRKDDCSLAQWLEDEIDFSDLPTIRHARRGVRGVAQELHDKAGNRSFTGFSVRALKLEDEKYAAIVTFILGATAAFILSLIFATAFQDYQYWATVGLVFGACSTALLIFSLRRMYADLWIRAAFRWWFVEKHKSRPSIGISETVNYLLESLRSKRLSIFKEANWNAYARDLEHLEEILKQTRKEKEEEGGLTDFDSDYDDLQSVSQKEEKMIQEILSEVEYRNIEIDKKLDMLINHLLPAYKLYMPKSVDLLARYKSRSKKEELKSIHLAKTEGVFNTITTIGEWINKSHQKVTDGLAKISAYNKEVEEQEPVIRLPSKFLHPMEGIDLDEDEPEIEEKQPDRGGGSIV